MKKKVIIFGKAGWPYTEKARSAYGNKAKYYDVEADNAKLDEMLKYSKGVRNVPVIVEGSKVTVGYEGSWGVWMTSRLLVHSDFITLKQIIPLLRHAGDLLILNDPFLTPQSAFLGC